MDGTNRIVCGLATGALTIFTTTVAAAEEPQIQALATVIKTEYPAIHQYVESLNEGTVRKLCGEEPINEGDLTDAEELQMLLNLASNITANADGLCVIRELQNMIGFGEQTKGDVAGNSQ